MSHSFHAAVASLRSRDWSYEDVVHDYENVYLKLTRRLEQLLGTTRVQGLRLLDLGCGYYYPNAALLHAVGVEVCGADVGRVFFREGRVATFRQRLRERGLLRVAYWAGRRHDDYRHYYATLTALARAGIGHRALSLSNYDGQRLPLADESFEAVCSDAVLEHVEDLRAFGRETARVLRPDGVIDMM